MRAEGVNQIVDIHNHVLFGLDDGARTLEESIEMIKNAKTQGIDVIVATPHLNHYQFSYDLSDLKKNYRKIQQKIIQEKLDILLILSHEIFLTIDFYEKYTMDELFPILTNKDEKKILVELPSYEVPYYFKEFIIQTAQKNMTCIWGTP